MRPLEDYAFLSQLLKSLLIKKLVLSPSSEDLWGILQKHPKLVVALNHGPSMAPSYVDAGLLNLFLRYGGSERSFVGVVWKPFYAVPGLRQMAQFITQVEEPVDFNGFLSLFKSEGVNDFFVMPEGENCTFGNGIDIEPFLSPRFLEIAISADAPVLLAVHHGSHLLANNLAVSDRMQKLFKWFPQRTRDRVEATKNISIPRWQGRLPWLQYTFKLYHPTLQLKELAKEPSERRAQLAEEGEKVRGVMQSMVEQLKQERKALQ